MTVPRVQDIPPMVAVSILSVEREVTSHPKTMLFVPTQRFIELLPLLVYKMLKFHRFSNAGMLVEVRITFRVSHDPSRICDDTHDFDRVIPICRFDIPTRSSGSQILTCYTSCFKHDRLSRILCELPSTRSCSLYKDD